MKFGEIIFFFTISWKYITLAEQKEVPDERDDSEKIMEIMQVLRWYFLERKYENTIDFQFFYNFWREFSRLIEENSLEFF